MNRKKLASLIALGMLISTTSSALAEIPRGTVIIDDKAYDLDYFNGRAEKFESIDLDEVIVKDFNGNFILNENGERVNPNLIPRVTYKNGEVTEYMYGDGEEVVFGAASLNVVSSKVLEISFNRLLDKETDKDSILVNGSKLGEKDKFEVVGKKIVITLEKELSKDGKNSVTINSDIQDVNGMPLAKGVSCEFVMLFKDSKIEKTYDCNVYLMDSSMSLRNVSTKGDIYIMNKDATLENVTTVGNIYVAANTSGGISLRSVNANNIIDISGASQKIELSTTVANKLLINNSAKSNIRVNSGTKISNTVVNSKCSIEIINGRLGLMDIECKAKEDIEINGKYEDTVRIWTPIQLTSNSSSEIKQVIINSNFKDNDIDIKANIETLVINTEKPVNIHGRVFVVDCEGNANINISTTGKVSYIAKNGYEIKVNNKGSQKYKEVATVTEVDYKENSNGNSNQGGGNWNPTPEQEVYNVISALGVEPILVDYETPKDKLPLPNMIKVKVKYKDKEKEESVKVLWDTSKYNPYKEGEYVLDGTLDLKDTGITNTENIKAQVKVIVGSQFIIEDVDIFFDEYVRFGTTREELSLPEFAQVMLNVGQIKLVPVIWDKSTFKENEVGKFTIEGQLDLSNTIIANPQNFNVTIDVIAEKFVVASINEEKALVSKGTLKEEVELPAYVEVITENESSKEKMKESVRVQEWVSEDYNSENIGTYTFTAKLNEEDLKNKKIFNEKGIGATAKVSVADSVDGIKVSTELLNNVESRVAIDINREDLQPNMTITIYNEEKQLLFKDQIKSEDNHARFTAILPNGNYTAYIWGIGDYSKVPVNIRVQETTYDIISVNSLGNITVPFETKVDELNLPSKVTANVKENGKDAVTEREVEVVWDTSKYNPYKSGEYVLEGQLKIDGSNLTNSGNHKAKIKVIVDNQFIIEDVDIFYDQYVRLGTTADELELPEVAQVMVSVGQIKDVPVIWDKSTFQEGKEGTFTIEGALDLSNTALTNPQNLGVSINVVVGKASVDTIYGGKTVALKGTEISELSLPDKVKVIVKDELTNKLSTEYIGVKDWTSDNYDNSKDGAYIFTASLNEEELLNKKIFNPSNKRPEVVVEVCDRFEGISSQISSINETENNIKITVENEKLLNNVTLTIYDKNKQLVFKDQVRKNESKAVFEAILPMGEYVGYIYGIEGYDKIPFKIISEEQDGTNYEDKYLSLNLVKESVDQDNVQVTFNTSIKENTLVDKYLTVVIRDDNEKVIYIDQVEVVNGKASFTSVLPKGIMTIQINTNEKNEKSIFTMDLSK